jgi:hypothetical protein
VAKTSVGPAHCYSWGQGEPVVAHSLASIASRYGQPGRMLIFCRSICLVIQLEDKLLFEREEMLWPCGLQ